MLKKTITYITFILLICITLVISYNEGCFLTPAHMVRMSDLSLVDQAQIDAATEKKEQSGRSFLSFSFEGFNLPTYDSSTNSYLFCASMMDTVSIAQNIRCEVSACYEGGVYTVLACKGDEYRLYRLEKTTLPIIFLQTGRPESLLVGDKESSGLFTVFDNASKSMRQFTATFKKRGGMSRMYPKSGMLVKLMDIRGAGVHASILGLSENTEFALNSLYDDATKIRDISAMRLWKQISTVGRTNTQSLGFGFEMTEAFINGEFAGLYGFHENVNLASFDLGDKPGLSVFKSTMHSVPLPEDLDPSSDEWGDVFLKDTSAAKPWTVVVDAVSQMFDRAEGEGPNGIFQLFDRENCIDFEIWCNLLAAKDNLWKNVVLLTDESDPMHKRVEIVPWDADLTFGAVYDNVAEYSTIENPDLATNPLAANRDNLYGMLWSESGKSFCQDTATRWFFLRQSVLSDDALLAMLNDTFSLISESGARERDAKRWPKSWHRTDNTFIEGFIEQRLATLDKFYQDYLPAQE